MSSGRERSKLLGTEPVGGLLLKFSVPAIFGMLVNALYNVVDRIFLGQVGKLAIGGVYITFPILLALMAFNMLIGIGGNSLSSIRLGQEREEDAQKILGNAFTMLLVLSILMSVVLSIFLKPILGLFGASKALMPYSLTYGRIILLGAPFQSVGFGLNHFIRGEGNPKRAMSTMLLGAVTNIVLDWLFILKFNWGVAGAAWATITGQALSAIWVVLYFTKGDSLLRLQKKYLKPEKDTVLEIMALGVAPFSMQLVNSLVTTLFNRSLQTYGGDGAVTAMGVIHSISTFAFMPVFGMNQGAQPILGYNFGAKKYKRMKTAFKYAVAAATIYMSLALVVILTFNESLISVFVPNPADFKELLPIIKPGLILWHITLPILGVQIIGSNYFQATGKPRIGTFLSLTRQLIILVPVLIFLPRIFGIMGIWYSVIVSDIAATILTVGFLIHDLRKYPDEDIGLSAG